MEISFDGQSAGRIEFELFCGWAEVDITQGDGTGGESIYGYSFKDENFEDGKNVAFGKAVSTDVLKLIEAACGSESGEVSKRITILDCGEVPQPGRQVKRLKRSDSAAVAGEVVMVLQLLRKHRECKKARQALGALDGSQRRAKFEDAQGWCWLKNFVEHRRWRVKTPTASPPRKATTTLHAAKDAAREWFSRGLRGSNQHGPAARAKLCKQLMLQLLERASQLCSGVSGSHVEDVLGRGRPTEEGPLICSLMARELRGSRYEGLWISRKGPAGHYYLGDEHEGHNLPTTDKDGDPIHPRVHAVVKVVSDQLVISGFFLDPDDDTMSPAKVPIGPFLSVYFEGMSVREASNAWKNGPPKRSATPRLAPAPAPAVPMPAAKQGVHMDPKLQELQAGLPPGWEVRESRCSGCMITTFDKSYTQFERLYMMIVKQLIETTLEPIHSMADTSRSSVVLQWRSGQGFLPPMYLPIILAWSPKTI
eukprot:s1075_g15.t1